jgi:hypothetical protein
MSDLRASEDEAVEREHARLRELARDAVLRAAAYEGQDCHNCEFFVDADARLAFCSHPRMQLLVDRGWWCQWWEERED